MENEASVGAYKPMVVIVFGLVAPFSLCTPGTAPQPMFSCPPACCPPQVCGGELGKVPPLLRWVEDEHALLVCPDMTSRGGAGEKGRRVASCCRPLLTPVSPSPFPSPNASLFLLPPHFQPAACWSWISTSSCCGHTTKLLRRADITQP